MAPLARLLARPSPPNPLSARERGNCEDTHALYPRHFQRNALKTNTPPKINPTELTLAYTAPALTREGFEELRTFEM
jgi:hypothetical protein